MNPIVFSLGEVENNGPDLERALDDLRAADRSAFKREPRKSWARFMVWVLTDKRYGLTATEKKQDAVVAARAASSLFRRVIAGKMVSDDEWRAVEDAGYKAGRPNGKRASRSWCGDIAYQAARARGGYDYDIYEANYAYANNKPVTMHCVSLKEAKRLIKEHWENARAEWCRAAVRVLERIVGSAGGA